MFENFNERIIGLEGTDGSGKNTVAIALIEVLLSQTESHILHTSFPNYWTPQGTIIREMNRELGDSFSDRNDLSLEDQLRLRAGMYALDRAITFLIVDQIQKHRNGDLIQVSDRLFLSQVNTLAYLVTKNNDFDTARKKFLMLFPIALKSDLELRSKTNNFNPILTPKSVKLSFSKSRPELDKLEGARPREFANWGYQLIPERYRSINSSIIENQNRFGNWMDKYDIALNVLKKAGFKNLKEVPVKRIFKNNILSSKKIEIISPTLYINTFYDISNEEMKNIKNRENKWKKLMVSYNEDSIEHFGREKKEYLNEMEEQMARSIAKIMDKYDPSDNKIKNLNDWPEKAINRLLSKYSKGNIIPFIKYCSKKLGYGSGYMKLLKKLGNNI